MLLPLNWFIWCDSNSGVRLLQCGLTTVNKSFFLKIAESLYNPNKWHGPQTPLKIFLKIPPKFHDKAVQSNILWLNVNKLGGKSILLSEQDNPAFHFHAPGSKRRYPCTQTASAVPKYFPCLLQFCTGYHIRHASRAWKRKTSEKRSFSHNKKYPDTINTFSLFLDEFL